MLINLCRDLLAKRFYPIAVLASGVDDVAVFSFLILISSILICDWVRLNVSRPAVLPIEVGPRLLSPNPEFQPYRPQFVPNEFGFSAVPIVLVEAAPVSGLHLLETYIRFVRTVVYRHLGDAYPLVFQPKDPWLFVLSSPFYLPVIRVLTGFPSTWFQPLKSDLQPFFCPSPTWCVMIPIDCAGFVIAAHFFSVHLVPVLVFSVLFQNDQPLTADHMNHMLTYRLAYETGSTTGWLLQTRFSLLLIDSNSL